MIASFGDKHTETLFHEGKRHRRLSQALHKIALRKLDMLDAAADLRDLRSPPGNRLEALKGDLVGMHSIRINDQWRIVFRWEASSPGRAQDVRIMDYHR